MKMQDEQLKELFQQKLSGHESPVNPSLWNNIQTGISGSSAGVAATAAKTGILKIASIVSGIVVTGGIVGYLVFNEPSRSEEIAAEKTQTFTPKDQGLTQPEADLTINTSESKVETPNSAYSSGTETLSSEINGSEEISYLDFIPESSDIEKPVENPMDHPTTPEPKDGDSTPKSIQESKNEDFTTDFNIVGTADMGLLKMLIPAYTKAHAYRWTIDHGDAVYLELSTTHDFGATGEHHVLLEIEKTPGAGFTEYSEKTICVCPSAEVRVDYDLFTPNGDSYSRVFDPQIQSRNIIPTRLLIFEKSTRKLVFEGVNENAKWDGTGSYGQEFPSGQYMYQFSYTDLCGKKLGDKTGFIELQR